jgi:Fur family zinc uptake transcriptional regulator
MQKINHIINKAKDVFTRSGRRLAEKRKHVLECLLESNTPLSVFGIAGAHNKVSEKYMQNNLHESLEHISTGNQA